MSESKQGSRKHRYAFEWYVNEQDEWYWRRAARRMQSITALAVAGVVIGCAALIVTIISIVL